MTPVMIRFLPIVTSLTTGALYLRERRIRRNLERLGAATLESLLDAIDANSPETGDHVRRVASYSLVIGDAVGLSEPDLRDVERVALFHDIGKLDGAVSDIVAEPKKLTPSERKSMHVHPRRGAEVLGPLKAFYPELPKGVLAHHERWDGKGYPHQLRRTAIPMTARIVSIADTFDAITHDRSYSNAKSIEEARERMLEGRGTQFDPDLLDLFLSPPVFRAIMKSMQRSHSPRRRGEGRRKRKQKPETPDVSFRWRRQAP